MGGFNEYGDFDGLGLADLVRTGQVSSEELLDEAIACTERVNPAINAVVAKFYDQAREAISRGLPDGRFAGVPFLLKDIHVLYAGVATTSGSRFLIDNVPDHDTEMVCRYKQGGLVIFGKTNTPEFGLNATTEPQLFGPTRNPWDTDRIAGGSSGGSAAAVAAGIVPVASGSDGGGSIRIPASCCGLLGLKPTRGRNPAGPDRGEGWSGMSVEHVISRSVRDSAAMMDLTSGPDVGAPYWAPRPERPFIEEVGADVGRLRIAFSSVPPSGAPVDPECVRAMEGAVRLVADLGHDAEEASPEVSAEEVFEAIRIIMAAGVASTVAQYAAARGRPASPSEFENVTWQIAQIGSEAPASAYVTAAQTLHRVGRQVGRFFEKYDVLITPTLSKPPLQLGILDMMSEDAEAYIEALWGYASLTPLFNVSGGPAMSVPLHWTPDNLPVGVQFVSRYADEALLFRLGAQLEEAKPWARRRPPVRA